MHEENGFKFIKEREEFQSRYPTQGNDVCDGPRLTGDRTGKPFVTGVLMYYTWLYTFFIRLC